MRRINALFFFFFALNIGLVFAQIEVKSPASKSAYSYDSLTNIDGLLADESLIGQEIIFTPLDSTISQLAGYPNIYTKKVKSADMSPSQFGIMLVPTDRKYIYSPNPSNPDYTDARTLAMSKWKITDSSPIGFVTPAYLTLRNDAGVEIYLNNQGVLRNVLILGYFEKLKQKYLNAEIISRKNVVLNDFYQNVSFFSPAKESWKVKDLIISMLDDDSDAKLYFLVTNGKGNQIVVPIEILLLEKEYKPKEWSALFLSTEWKTKFNLSPESWEKVVAGVPKVGMTKAEIFAILGVPQNPASFTSGLAFMEADEWSYRDDLEISFSEGKAVEISNYTPPKLLESPVQFSRE
jgi:hypothetical protein